MGRVPIAWRQLAAERGKLAVTLTAVAAAVALVLLLGGLRRGMGEQVTLYLDHQAAVLVGQRGTRNFLAQTSVLPEGLETAIDAMPGVAEAVPITQQFALLRLHERRVLSLLIGYDPGRPGGPWRLASGRLPRRDGELVLDRVLASEHGLVIGSGVSYRGTTLRIVGLSRGTSGFMTPLAFTTRRTVDALGRQPGTVNFFSVRPEAGVSPEELATGIERAVPGVSALTRSQVAANDRRLFVDPFSGPLLAMVAIAFAVAVLVIGLAVYGSTAERSREYATLKALGLRRGALLRLVGTQAAGLALAGTAAGVLVAFAAARAVGALAPRYLIAIDAPSVVLIATSSLVMALLAALLPARLLARLDPASAFRR